MFNKEFLESHDIIPALMPADLSAAANKGDRVNLQNYDRCVLFYWLRLELQVMIP